MNTLIKLLKIRVWGILNVGFVPRIKHAFMSLVSKKTAQELDFEFPERSWSLQLPGEKSCKCTWTLFKGHR